MRALDFLFERMDKAPGLDQALGQAPDQSQVDTPPEVNPQNDPKKFRATAKTLPGYDPKNPLHSSLTRVLSRQKYAAQKDGKAYDIDLPYAWNLIKKQGFKCALSGVPFVPAGGYAPNQPSLDRIDSNKGYEPGNVQFVTLRINYAKKSMTDAEFIAMCKQVASYS
jgi:hypothetical protein